MRSGCRMVAEGGVVNIWLLGNYNLGIGGPTGK